MKNAQLLTSIRPLTNNSRRYIWALAYQKATGKQLQAGPFNVCGCRICKKLVWIKKSSKASILDITCSANCFMQLEELRIDKHWS